MFKFIKNLLGIGAQESVKEIVTPPAYNPPKEVVITRILAPASNPDVIVTPVLVKKPQPGKKVKAISVPIKEGNQRTNVKKPNPNNAKPSAPPAPKPKAKNKSKPKTKK